MARFAELVHIEFSMVMNQILVLQFIYLIWYAAKLWLLARKNCITSWFKMFHDLLKIHSFLKQCLRNLHFFKTRYFSRNLSISCSIQVPCFDKLKIVHNTDLKMNGLYWEYGKFFQVQFWMFVAIFHLFRSKVFPTSCTVGVR